MIIVINCSSTTHSERIKYMLDTANSFIKSGVGGEDEGAKSGDGETENVTNKFSKKSLHNVTSPSSKPREHNFYTLSRVELGYIILRIFLTFCLVV